MTVERINLQKEYEKAREKMTPLQKLIDDLYFDYDRMSRSGQETIDKLADEVKLWNN